MASNTFGPDFGVIPQQRASPRSRQPADTSLQAVTSSPAQHTVMLSLQGAFEQHHVAHVRELLNERLGSTIQLLVVDCSQLSFLCVDALELLYQQGRLAGFGGITLGIVTGTNPAVCRACLAAELHQHASLVDDLTSLPQLAITPTEQSR